MNGARIVDWPIAFLLLCAIVALALIPPSAVQGMEHAAPYRAAAGCRELVVNGGFEQAGQSWTQAPNPAGRALVTNFYWKSGQYAADLGGVNSATDRLTQVIALPADVNEITLAYWWALQTEEASTGAAFDRLSVELYQLNGMTRVATLLTVDNTVAESWVWNRASINLTSYRGQTLLLRFTASTDDSKPTRFFVDDVSVQGCARQRVYLPLVWRAAP